MRKWGNFWTHKKENLDTGGNGGIFGRTKRKIWTQEEMGEFLDAQKGKFGQRRKWGNFWTHKKENLDTGAGGGLHLYSV